MATAYYNENNPFAAQRLREFIAAGYIAPGIVDERSIEDVTPNDLRGFTQCHFCAGIGVWSYAMRRAGWRDDRHGWTASLPCQPFSQAGKGDGFDDERHLWPAFDHLRRECKPRVIFGEQVASKDGLAWLDLVQADLEATGYAIGTIDLCAAGFGAPHQRQRIFWVADTIGGELPGGGGVWPTGWNEPSNCRAAGGMDNTKCIGWKQGRNRNNTGDDGQQLSPAVKNDFTSPTKGYWRDADWLFCRDGKWRPVEPGTLPLANGITSRVGKIKTYGNAIVAPVAEEFIRSYMEIRNHE